MQHILGSALTGFLARNAACAVLACGIAVPAHADKPDGVTPGELALTPAFCQDAQTFNGWSQGFRESPRSGFWISQMGQAFWAIHHYCWAAINTRRANGPGVEPRVRAHLLRTAIDDYMYVLNHATAEFPLTPEIYYLIGDTHLMLGEHALAMQAFQLSRKAKADYWPPYVAEAKILESMNRRSEAREMIQQGLQLMPQEPALLEQQRRLGSAPAATARAPARTAGATAPAAPAAAPR